MPGGRFRSVQGPPDETRREGEEEGWMLGRRKEAGKTRETSEGGTKE